MFSFLMHRLRDFRNRKVGDPAFRRWAARFPLTRPVARSQAKALFDLTAGFVYSQILSACVRVDLFEKLSGGPRDIASIATAVGLDADATERLLRAAAALGLVERRNEGRYALGSLGAALVNNAGVTAMIRHHDMLYGDLRDPIALLAGGGATELQRYWAYAGGGRPTVAPPGRHADYSRLMAVSQSLVTAEILDAYALSRHEKMLDVGGGDATFLIAAAAAAPRMTLELFDLPPVVAIARQRILEAGLSGRAKAFAGSFLTDDLPGGADLVVLNRVLHDHDDSAVRVILASIRRAMAPGGTLLIAEPMAGTRGAEASGDAYFGFYLFAMGQGRPRTLGEIRQLLDASGFTTVREVATATPLIARIVTAKPTAQE